MQNTASDAEQTTQSDAVQPASLTGSRTDRIAGILRNIIAASPSRSWEGALAAFPGARWSPRQTHAPLWGGSTVTHKGSINLAGAVYNIEVYGTANRVNDIQLFSPGDDTVEWEPIARSLRKLGVQLQNVGCHSPTGFGYVRLTGNGQSAILHKSVNYGSAVPSTDVYHFGLNDPFEGRTEAQVIADRTMCS